MRYLPSFFNSALFGSKLSMEQKTQMCKVIHKTYIFVLGKLIFGLFKSSLQSIHYRTLRKVITIVAVCGYGFFCIDALASNEPSTQSGIGLSTERTRLSTGYASENRLYVKLNKVRVSSAKQFSRKDFPRLAEAIRRAENSKRYPYGIIAKYCSPKTEAQCKKGCLQTIEKRYGMYLASGKDIDFIEYLSRSYAPLNAKNDPSGLNHNWIKNVRYFYQRLGGTL